MYGSTYSYNYGRSPSNAPHPTTQRRRYTPQYSPYDYNIPASSGAPLPPPQPTAWQYSSYGSSHLSHSDDSQAYSFTGDTSAAILNPASDLPSMYHAYQPDFATPQEESSYGADIQSSREREDSEAQLEHQGDSSPPPPYGEQHGVKPPTYGGVENDYELLGLPRPVSGSVTSTRRASEATLQARDEDSAASLSSGVVMIHDHRHNSPSVCRGTSSAPPNDTFSEQPSTSHGDQGGRDDRDLFGHHDESLDVDGSRPVTAGGLQIPDTVHRHPPIRRRPLNLNTSYPRSRQNSIKPEPSFQSAHANTDQAPSGNLALLLEVFGAEDAAHSELESTANAEANLRGGLGLPRRRGAVHRSSRPASIRASDSSDNFDNSTCRRRVTPTPPAALLDLVDDEEMSAVEAAHPAMRIASRRDGADAAFARSQLLPGSSSGTPGIWNDDAALSGDRERGEGWSTRARTTLIVGSAVAVLAGAVWATCPWSEVNED